MNKKLFLGMLTVAGVLLATSCSKNELDSGLAKNQAEITFSLTAEDGIATRANISDGKKADVLVYAVFDKDGQRLSGIEAVTKTGVTFPTTENIILAKGQTYKVAFWAQDEDCKAYTVDTDNMTVSVNYAHNENKVNNDETRDAFFRTVEFTVTGSTSIDVEMRRPFAQINVGVTDKDWKDAVASGIQIDQSAVVIKDAATTLNLLDGTVGTETVDVTYALSTIPEETLMVDSDSDGIKEEYHWLSMSYILPADNTTGYAKTTLENIAFEFAPDNDAYSHIYFNQGLNNVPVQRNWRTNILGRLLTGDITFNIVIDPVYENDHNVMTPYATIGGTAYASFADAMAAVQDGETIKLEGETTLQGIKDNKLFTVNKNITIDLNGYGFVANMPDVTQNSSIFEVDKDGELTIIGDGNVKFVTKAAPKCLAAFINNIGGTVNLKGGNWTISEIGGYALIPTFVDNNSNTSNVTLNIYDGTYTFNRNLFRNFANAASHNNYATVATINIYGGTFNGRESDAGAIWNQKPRSDSNIPADAGVINFEGGTLNNVVIIDEFAGVVYVNSQDELTEALQNVNIHTIMLGTGEYIADIYNGTPKRKSLAIIGSEGTKFGHTATTGGQLRLDLFDSFTIKNCEIIQRSGVKTWGHLVFGASKKANGVYTIENCTFNGVGTQGIYINENVSGATYNILNCTFNGDFGSEGAITIQTNKDVNHIVNVKDCTFNNIPATSHRIYLAPNNGFYYGWTLDTDLEATTAYEVKMFASLGFTTRVYGLTLIPDGDNSKIIVNDKEGFLNLTKLFADWTDLFTDGNGTSYNNYANGAGADYYYSGRWTVSLEADIDLNDETIDPVVIKHPVSAGSLTFEGNNHTIKNAKIKTDATTENQAGLFVSAYCGFKNLKLDNIHVTGSNVGNSTAGVLVGSNSVGIDKITITNSSVTNGKYTGGVVGYGYTDVLNCELSKVTVKGGYKLGGLIGYICATSPATGEVTGNTLTDCTVDGIGGGVYAGGKSEYIVGKLVGNYNCNGTCSNNTITNMTTSATENIGQIEAGMTVNQ